MKKIGRELLIAYSLAALSFITVWGKTINNRWYYDYPGWEYDPASLPIAFFWMVLWGLILFFANKISRGLGIVLTAIALLMAINGIRQELGFSRTYAGTSLLLMSAFIGTWLLLYLLWKRPDRFERGVKGGSCYCRRLPY